MKKFLSLIASLIIVCACAVGLSACWDSNSGKNEPDIQTDGTLVYTAVRNSSGRITGYTVKGVEDTVTEIDIPSFYKYEWRPVVGIEANAFYGNTQIESVAIPSYLTEVGENAFAGCKNLESVYIGKITSIGKNAFAKCENLKSVSVSSVEDWCNISFANMGANPMYFATEFCVGDKPVEDLVIPFVAQIPDFAFYECENIKSVTIERALRIGNSAFYGSAIESVNIDWGAIKMGELVFADCLSLKSVELGRFTKVIGEYAFLRCSQLEEVTVPASVQRIEESAFTDCAGMRTVNLNEGLEYIGDCAFSGCVSLAEFNMPSTVNEIGFGIIMFGGSSGFGPIGDTSNQVGKITLSDNLTEIPDFSFSFCGIETITIGSKVTNINYSAFYGCGNLESVVIPQSVTKITSYAFYKCPSLSTVYYKGTAEEWGAITIGKSGNDISTAAIYYYSENPPAEEGDFWHYVSGVPTKW